jgi:hypothetical protein
LKPKAQKVTIHAEAAKHAMEQSCAAGDCAKADSMAQRSKEAAKAALNNAKKAKACADKLPAVSPDSKKDLECPSSWNRYGNYCCPPEVPCWDYGAIERAVKAGRCR